MDGYWLDLGLMSYAPAFVIQEQLLEARIRGWLPSTILLQENPLTFTIGRSGSRDNILASTDELNRLGIEVIEANRGGDVTYHGPGQLIASPLMYLGDFGINANQYMHWMEAVLIGVLDEFGIRADQRDEYPGVWYGEAKIGSVGIAVRHGYTFHGISLNVNLDLSPFQLINPCGMVNMPVTSMEKVLGCSVSMDHVRVVLRRIFEVKFDLHLREALLSEIQLKINEASYSGQRS